MPVLKDFRKTKELILPSYPDSKVVVYSGLLFGDALGIKQTDDVGYVLNLLPKLIKEWNFADEAGVQLPINDVSLKMLGAKDVEFLIVEIQKFVEQEKKN